MVELMKLNTYKKLLCRLTQANDILWVNGFILIYFKKNISPTVKFHISIFTHFFYILVVSHIDFTPLFSIFSLNTRTIYHEIFSRIKKSDIFLKLSIPYYKTEILDKQVTYPLPLFK